MTQQTQSSNERSLALIATLRIQAWPVMKASITDCSATANNTMKTRGIYVGVLAAIVCDKKGGGGEEGRGNG